MVQRIEEHTEMSCMEMRRRFETKWIIYRLVEHHMTEPDTDRVIPMALADSNDEAWDAFPCFDEPEAPTGVAEGYGVGGCFIGGIELRDIEI